MMRKIVALLYIFVFAFTSCIEEIDYEDLGVKNFIVLNAMFVDGETPNCQVSGSDIIFEQVKNKVKPTVFLPDAKVTVTDGSSDYSYKVIGDSAKMEANGLIVKAGETYTIRAKASGLDDVYSTVCIPSKPKCEMKLVSAEMLTGNDMTYWGLYEEYKTCKATYELTLEDDPNTEDYYQITFYANVMEYKYESQVVDTSYGYWIDDNEWIATGPVEIYGWVAVDSTITYKECYWFMESNDAIMNWNQARSDNDIFEAGNENYRNIFNDQLFNGKTTKIRFFKYINYNRKYDNIIYDDPIYYELRHISKETYMFYRTYYLVLNNEYNGSLSPHMLYCNVENGAGLVSAWSKEKRVLEIPKMSK